MSSFDKIIGYNSVKKELMQFCDMIHNKGNYDKLGAKMPKGILISGDPGLGKTLMVKCLIEESGLKAYTIRKNKSENFAEYISDVFSEAKENTPCIVFLDDMDKFANEDERHCDADEYVAVQAAIDEVRDKEVFIFATVNEMYKLPDSLTRAGRFDRIIRIKRPNNAEYKEIVKHYISEKVISENLNIDDISKMLNYNSCAELETIVNEAAINAAYERKTAVDKDDFICAILKLEYNLLDSCENADSEEIKKVAIHEAGHVVMSEALLPESVGFVTLGKENSGGICGFVHRCKDIESCSQKILISLAGKTASELYFGTYDRGSGIDLENAYRCLRDEISENGLLGFSMLDVSHRLSSDTSESMNSRIEAVVQAELERYMFKAKEIILKNKEFLEKVSQALEEKNNLLSSDIQKIKAGTMVYEFAE